MQGGDQVSINAMNQPHKPFNFAYSNTYNPGWRNHLNFSWKNTKNSNLSQGGQTSSLVEPQANPMGSNPYGYQNQGQANGPQANYQNHNPNLYHHPQKQILEDTLRTFMQSQQASWVKNNQALVIF